MATAPAKRTIKCRCGSIELTLIESIENYTTFQQYPDKTIDIKGEHSSGEYFKVSAKCSKCGHKWRIRKATQITDIREN